MHARRREQSRLLSSQQITAAGNIISRSILNISEQNLSQVAVKVSNISGTATTRADQFPQISWSDNINIAVNAQVFGETIRSVQNDQYVNNLSTKVIEAARRARATKEGRVSQGRNIVLNIQLVSPMTSVRGLLLAAFVALCTSTQRDC